MIRMIIILIYLRIIVSIAYRSGTQLGMIVVAETAAVYIIVVIRAVVRNFEIGITVFNRLLRLSIVVRKINIGVFSISKNYFLQK